MRSALPRGYQIESADRFRSCFLDHGHGQDGTLQSPAAQMFDSDDRQLVRNRHERIHGEARCEPPIGRPSRYVGTKEGGQLTEACAAGPMRLISCSMRWKERPIPMCST